MLTSYLLILISKPAQIRLFLLLKIIKKKKQAGGRDHQSHDLLVASILKRK